MSCPNDLPNQRQYLVQQLPFPDAIPGPERAIASVNRDIIRPGPLWHHQAELVYGWCQGDGVEMTGALTHAHGKPAMMDGSRDEAATKTAADDAAQVTHGSLVSRGYRYLFRVSAENAPRGSPSDRRAAQWSLAGGWRPLHGKREATPGGGP